MPRVCHGSVGSAVLSCIMSLLSAEPSRQVLGWEQGRVAWVQLAELLSAGAGGEAAGMALGSCWSG